MNILPLQLVMRALGFEPRNAEIEKISEKVKVRFCTTFI